jgi:uncharacterized damage-inducible protein DinB
MALASDPYEILLGHNRWANAELLSRCTALTEEEFHRRFDIGPGSLHDTLTHIVACIARWSDRIEGRTLRPSPGGPQGGPVPRRAAGALIELNDAACEEFAGVVRGVRAGGAIGEERELAFGEVTYRFTVAAAILHVTNHGMHHRAQCMNMFRRLGRPVDAALDELEWQSAGEP